MIKAVKQDLTVITQNPGRQEGGTVQQYAKYADTFIKYSFNTTKISEFKILQPFDTFALVAINNGLSQDVKEIFFNLTRAIMRKIRDDQDLFYIILDLNSIKFTGVKMDQDPYKHKVLIAENCKNLNKLYQNLARFILKPHGLKVKKELMDILQDFVSALDRVDIQFDCLKTSGQWKSWWTFVADEYNNVISCLYMPRYNGINEGVADLNLRTLRETARDIIRSLQKLLYFLHTVVPMFSKIPQMIVKRTINCTNEIILNFELNLRKEHLDVRELIRDSLRDIFDLLKSLKELLVEQLYENDIDNYHDKQESVNLKWFAHYVVTSYIVIFRRCYRRVVFLR